MNNAGIAKVPSTDGSGPRQVFHEQSDVNLFGTAVVTEAFLPLLKRSTSPDGKRISFTSSSLASPQMAAENPHYSAVSWHIYRSTKTAMSMVMLYYAQSLEKEGFVVGAADPGKSSSGRRTDRSCRQLIFVVGYCATNLNDHQGLKDPRLGARALIISATGKKEEVHGRIVDEQGKAEPW
jgi:NAD(P)-dependent dehydrogenase (short-subunit alcohol dehydrogenase family)